MQSPVEGLRMQQPKCCMKIYNNKDEKNTEKVCDVKKLPKKSLITLVT